MASRQQVLAMFHIISILMAAPLAHARLGLSSTLRVLSQKALTMDLGDISLLQSGPQLSAYTVGAGVVAYRSSVVSGLSHLDRGENTAAMETFRVAIASLTMDTTQTFGLPIISTVIDKIVTKYGTNFKKTLSGFRTYNQMLGDSILTQVGNVASPGMFDDANNVIHTLDTLKKRIRTDFANEVDSFLKSSQAFEDLVKPLQKAKSWAKVAKWADFLLGPIFDAANIAFSGWQLHGAIQSGNQLAIASSSIGIAGSIVGIGAFVVGSLATAGSVIAAVAGPVGAIIGCVLTLASLIIDVINEYNPTQKINEHLQLVRSLTKASKDQMKGLHYETLLNITGNGVKAGFGTFFDVNQAMLVKATILDQWDTITGLKGNEERLVFKPELVKSEEDYLVVGDIRVFDKANYANWLFKPSGTEEIGYNYYGKRVKESDEGIFVRLNTDMVTNRESNMMFWLNGADVTTYEEGQENAVVHDNVNIGDFRTFYTSSNRYLDIKTGGGDDLVQLTGIICSAEQQKILRGKCLLLRMGDGFDTLSFEGMDMKEEKREWFLENGDLSKSKEVVGVVFDAKDDWIGYRIQGDDGVISDVRFGGMSSVEGFIGSPMNDIVKMDDGSIFHIKQSAGLNVYEIYYSLSGENRQHFIEDNSDTPGKVVLHREGLLWENVFFDASTNIIIVNLGKNDVAEIFLKRTKPRLGEFRVKVGSSNAKKVSDLPSIGKDADLLLPYVPYQYKFDRNLIARADQETNVELCLPQGPYPNPAVTFNIRFVHIYSNLILSQDLLDSLRENRFSLVARRRGSVDTEGKWTLVLQKPNGFGGWKVNIGQFAEIVVGAPGNFQPLFSLGSKEESEINIFREYQTIKRERKFDSTGSYYGDDDAEKVVLVYPNNFVNINPPAEHVIDLKGPERPTADGRNELVIDNGILVSYFKHELSRYMKMDLERNSVKDDWHLKIYSNWGQKILRVDVTLKNVHAITADRTYAWRVILDLYNSQETSYDLNYVMWEKFGNRY